MINLKESQQLKNIKEKINLKNTLNELGICSIVGPTHTLKSESKEKVL